VAHVIISQCSLKSLLTLRQVCKTTKSWVEDFPKAEKLMSKLQIRMGIDLPIIKQFNESPPPLPITSLSLDTSKLDQVDSPEDYSDTWNAYFGYWSPRLVSLEIQKLSVWKPMFPLHDTLQIRTTIRRFLDDCPRLTEVVFLRDFDWLLASPIPKSFLNITHLAIDAFDFHKFQMRDEDVVTAFFADLTKNKNLKEFS